MRIETEILLDFRDVLIRPKRSTLKSRSEVDLNRLYKFKNNKSWSGIGVIAANMDTVGTFAMAKKLAENNCMTALHKHYSAEDLINFWTTETKEVLNNIFYSIGIVEQDLVKLRTVKTELEKKNITIDKICIDVANGYSQGFVDFIKIFRDEFPDVIVMAGNVVTGEMTEELILSGVDIVKVGIGPGCFIPGSLVLTREGLKPIEQVKIGDWVLTHKGNWQQVSKTFQYDEKQKVVSVNGIKSTAHHEYYVLDKKYKDIVTDDNIGVLAEWIPAEKLTKNHLLLKHI